MKRRLLLFVSDVDDVTPLFHRADDVKQARESFELAVHHRGVEYSVMNTSSLY